MTTLAADAPRAFFQGDFQDQPVIASDIIYQGAAVGDDGNGYMRPLVAGDPFRGFADYKADNASGAAGDKYVRLRTKGKIQLAISSLAITDVGRPVYASDDAVFTLVGAANSYIGRVSRYVSSGVGVVAFDAEEPENLLVMDFPVNLASITGAGDVVTNITPGFHGRLKDWEFIVTQPVTTAAKAATLNVEIGTTDATGGTIALTSANCTPLGAKVAKGSAFTAGNSFKATDTLSIEAASVTAFAEGAGVLRLTFGR